MHQVLEKHALRNIMQVSLGIDVGQGSGWGNENGQRLSQAQRVAQRMAKSFRHVLDAPMMHFNTVKLVVLLPVWMQQYASVLPFYFSALVPGSMARKLKVTRTYLTKAILCLVNNTRLAMG